MPIYYKIYNKLKNDIISGLYEKNNALPSERQLMLIFDASRTTIRQALLNLKNEGYIYKIQGKGNFVSGSLINQDLNRFYSFHNKITSIGKKPSSKLISYDIIEADAFFSEIFGINEKSKVYHIKRLRLIDEKPAMLEDTYLPEYRFSNFDFEKLNKISMYKIFEDEYKIMFSRASEKFKPIKATNSEDTKYLSIKKNDVVMQIIRTTYEMERVIEYTVSHVKNNVFEYTVDLKL